MVINFRSFFVIVIIYFLSLHRKNEEQITDKTKKGFMNRIVLFILMTLVVASCASNKRIVAPPFEKEEAVTAPNTPARTIREENLPEKPVVSKEEKVTLTHGDTMKKYNVIVGSFQSVDNALKLRNRLKSEGYNSIIMKNESGMYRVSIASFDEEVPARNELARVRATDLEFSDAWLLIVKGDE